MAGKYFSLNEVPIGTKMIVKKTKEEGELFEIQNFPTTNVLMKVVVYVLQERDLT